MSRYNLSKRTKMIFVLLFCTIALLTFISSTGCGGEEDNRGYAELIRDAAKEAKATAEAIKDDAPRMGDGMKIGEKFEETVCKSQGRRWDDAANECR